MGGQDGEAERRNGVGALLELEGKDGLDDAEVDAFKAGVGIIGVGLGRAVGRGGGSGGESGGGRRS